MSRLPTIDRQFLAGGLVIEGRRGSGRQKRAQGWLVVPRERGRARGRTASALLPSARQTTKLRPPWPRSGARPWLSRPTSGDPPVQPRRPRHAVARGPAAKEWTSPSARTI